jgi:hypothetical protein
MTCAIWGPWKQGALHSQPTTQHLIARRPMGRGRRAVSPMSPQAVRPSPIWQSDLLHHIAEDKHVGYLVSRLGCYTMAVQWLQGPDPVGVGT